MPRRKSPYRPLSGAQAGALGLQKGYKNLWILTIFGLEASQGGTKQQDQQEEQQDGPKGPIARFDPPTFGLGVPLGNTKGL